MSRRKKLRDGQFWKSLDLNELTFRQYYNKLTELSTCMFDWQNLPDTVDPRFLEMTLFSQGFAVFFYDDVLGYLALRCATAGKWNVYNIPIRRRAYASNGYNKKLTSKNSVIIWNNYIHTNSMLDVEMYAHRLADIDRAIDTNVRAQRTPVLIRCSQEQRLTMKELYMQYDGNQPFIFADKNLDPSQLTVLKTDAPFVAQDLYQMRTQYWNEALTHLGISNLNLAKKERLITDEVQRTQGSVTASRYSRLEMRRQACREINEMFGLDLWVDFREDLRIMYEQFIEDETGNKVDVGSEQYVNPQQRGVLK